MSEASNARKARYRATSEASKAYEKAYAKARHARLREQARLAQHTALMDDVAAMRARVAARRAM